MYVCIYIYIYTCIHTSLSLYKLDDNSLVNQLNEAIETEDDGEYFIMEIKKADLYSCRTDDSDQFHMGVTSTGSLVCIVRDAFGDDVMDGILSVDMSAQNDER